jgi:hypothetical protein
MFVGGTRWHFQYWRNASRNPPYIFTSAMKTSNGLIVNP